jgi:hypothetical protein
VAIVHFHGPKPGDYLAYANSGACPRFGGMCKVGRGAGGRGACWAGLGARGRATHGLQAPAGPAKPGRGRATACAAPRPPHLPPPPPTPTPHPPKPQAGIDARACVYTHEWVRRAEGDEAAALYKLWRTGCAKA